ncbi:hypothetical protein BACI71_40409 [Bacillus mycoides]|uniref:Uncharacterized protein n=1 Tax=Bacillus mycoides TaxID=1405 RepID=A0A654A0U0_BACMY|nr:hypothetical protein BACI71_40409 [Bacillus mycoides]
MITCIIKQVSEADMWSTLLIKITNKKGNLHVRYSDFHVIYTHTNSLICNITY